MTRSKYIKLLSELLNDSINLGGLKLTAAERQILSALKVIANRYDDVYAPQIQEIESDIKKILDKFEISLKTFNDLADKVTQLPSKNFCKLREDQIREIFKIELKNITLPRLIWMFFKDNKWNTFYLMMVLMLLFPLLQFVFVTFFAAVVEKIFNINIFDVWPFLKQIIQ